MIAAEKTRVRPANSHPAAFMILILPWGIITGYMGIAVAYFLAQPGVSTEQIAGLLALSFIPQTWKFLWAPSVDTTLNQRKWYVLAALVCGVGTLALSTIPPQASSVLLLAAVMLVTYVAGTFLCMSVESLMAYATLAREKAARGAGCRLETLEARVSAEGLGSGLPRIQTGLWQALYSAPLVYSALSP
jgi:MFS transporter, PAT family, beta-lactamase induction signal transducer AmpG